MYQVYIDRADGSGLSRDYEGSENDLYKTHVEAFHSIQHLRKLWPDCSWYYAKADEDLWPIGDSVELVYQPE